MVTVIIPITKFFSIISRLDKKYAPSIESVILRQTPTTTTKSVFRYPLPIIGFFSTAAYQTDYLLRCLRSGNWRDALGLWLPNLIACFSALILLAKAAPRLRASQTAWFLAYYIIAVGATWLLSAPRYLLVLLPVPLALAQCAQKRTANIILTAVSALAALGYLAAFALRWQVW